MEPDRDIERRVRAVLDTRAGQVNPRTAPPLQHSHNSARRRTYGVAAALAAAAFVVVVIRPWGGSGQVVRTRTAPPPTGSAALPQGCEPGEVSIVATNPQEGAGQTTLALILTLRGARLCELPSNITVDLVAATGTTLAATPPQGEPAAPPFTLAPGRGAALTISYAAHGIPPQNCPRTAMAAAAVTIGANPAVTVALPAGAVFVCGGTRPAIAPLQPDLGGQRLVTPISNATP